jgi:hypothetical protein
LYNDRFRKYIVFSKTIIVQSGATQAKIKLSL